MQSTGRNNSMILGDMRGPQMKEEQTYQCQLRKAMEVIKPTDLEAVVQGIVDRAKSGDKHAIEHLMKLYGAGKPVAITNNLIVQDVETAARIARASQPRMNGGKV